MKNKEANKNTEAANTPGNRPEVNQPIQNSDAVEKNSDAKIDQDYPGYPHYPASEDIMQPDNHTERVTAELDEVSKRDLNHMHLDRPVTKDFNDIPDAETDMEIVPGTEADVTKEDLQALGDENRDMDDNEDEDYISTGSGGAFEATENIDDSDVEPADAALFKTGDNLDVPGSEQDDANENLGEEDEENNYYSLGGDRHD